VTNFAARLCAEASTGEALVNLKVIDNVEPLVTAPPVGTLALKGLLQSVRTFALTGMNPESREN